MRLPKRRSRDLLQPSADEPFYLTPEGIRGLERELERLDTVERPQAVQDVSAAVQKGDLSENAEYQEARSRLSRLEGRIFSLRDRLKRAEVIKKKPGGAVDIGSVVVVLVNGAEKTFAIVGPQEVNAATGRISYLSPLGSALMGHTKDQSVRVTTDAGSQEYLIRDVR